MTYAELTAKIKSPLKTLFSKTFVMDALKAIMTKLNAVQVSVDDAASSYTAADVLTKIKTVDGPSSGLDADLLDGREASYFQPLIPSFSALVRQNNVELESGLLSIGTRYIIYTLEPGDDFDNVGFVSEGVSFVATATTPTVWTESTHVIDVDASVVETVLQNTLGYAATFDLNADLGIQINTTIPNALIDKIHISGAVTKLAASANKVMCIPIVLTEDSIAGYIEIGFINNGGFVSFYVTSMNAAFDLVSLHTLIGNNTFCFPEVKLFP